MATATQSRSPLASGVVKRLGWLGLIPFLMLAGLVTLDTARAPLWLHFQGIYTFGILSFLLGSWWGMGLIKQDTLALVTSNIAFLLIAFGFALLPSTQYLLLAATLFIALVIFERRHVLFRPQPLYYARLRLSLSATASITLLYTAASTA